MNLATRLLDMAGMPVQYGEGCNSHRNDGPDRALGFAFLDDA